MDLYQQLSDAGIKCHITYYRQLDARIWPEGNIFRVDQNSYYTRHDLNVMGLTGRSFSPRGGETRAIITLPSGKEYVGVAMCSRKDNFSRKAGRNLALWRALWQAAKEELPSFVLLEFTNALMMATNSLRQQFSVDCNGICTRFWVDSRCPKHSEWNPPVMTEDELRKLGHPNPSLGAGLSRMGFETRPGHTYEAK